MSETHVDVWRFGSTHVVAITGVLDLAASVELRLALYAQLDAGARDVVVDLSAVPILDASAVGVLLTVQEQLDRAGGALRVHGADALARSVLEVTGAAKSLLVDQPAPDRTAEPGSTPGRWGERVDSLLVAISELPADDPDRSRLRRQVIEACLPYAERLARRFHGLGEPVADLNQVAALGLVKAVDRFDPRLGTDFSRYAAPTIVGELKRHFRDRGWSVRVPRRLQDLRLAVNQARSELAQRLNHSPTAAEVADYLHIDEEQVLETIVAANGYRAASLYAPTRAGVTATAPVHWLGAEDAALDAVEDREVLAPLLAALPDREQKILSLRFYGNLTQAQIADKLGISQMHVSRLLTKVLARLRAELVEQS